MKNKKCLYNCNIFTENTFRKGIICINNEKIEKVIYEDTIEIIPDDYTKIDCENGYVSFGFLDPHVHFRTPGNEDKEDWKSGSRAALNGGFTYVIDMPNNKPPAVNFDVLSAKNEIAHNDSYVNFGFYIGLTKENSENISKIIDTCRQNNIHIHGIKVFLGSSTGNLLVTELDIIKKALETGEIVLFHAEDESVLKNTPFTGNIQHEQARPEEAESSALTKIAIAASDIKTNANIYVCHLSSKKGIDKIIALRNDGYNIITEVTPHHLYFSLDKIKNNDAPFYKINPPIRNQDSVDALRNAFNNGIINILGTDHAPHLLSEKRSNNPPSGFPGLETAFYALNSLAQKKIISFNAIFQYLTSGYKIFNIKDRGEIKTGNFADLVLIKHKDFVFSVKNAATKANFSPYEGLQSNLFIDSVFINGKIILENGKITGDKK